MVEEGQDKHTVTPAGEYNPDGQYKQPTPFAANVPAGHTEHALDRERDQEPAGHRAHTEPFPLEYRPELQGVHTA